MIPICLLCIASCLLCLKMRTIRCAFETQFFASATFRCAFSLSRALVLAFRSDPPVKVCFERFLRP